MNRQHLALSGLLKLAPARPIGCFGPLEFCELIEDDMRQLPFWRVVSPVVQRTNFANIFLKLPVEQLVIGGLTS